LWRLQVNVLSCRSCKKSIDRQPPAIQHVARMFWISHSRRISSCPCSVSISCVRPPWPASLAAQQWRAGPKPALPSHSSAASIGRNGASPHGLKCTPTEPGPKWIAELQRAGGHGDHAAVGVLGRLDVGAAADEKRRPERPVAPTPFARMRRSKGDKQSLAVPQCLRRIDPNSATGRSGRGQQADGHDQDGGRREDPRNVPPSTSMVEELTPAQVDQQLATSLIGTTLAWL
jgi:hypothetical protein